MGLLFSTRGTRRIVVALNKAFNRRNLDKIRADEVRRQWLTHPTRNWKLWSLARVYELYPWDPDDVGNENSPGFRRDRRRWNYFLRKVLLTPQHNTVRDSIRDAIANRDYFRLSFDHVHIGQTEAPDVVIFDKTFANGRKLRHITLFTPRIANAAEEGSEFTAEPGDPPVESYPNDPND